MPNLRSTLLDLNIDVAKALKSVDAVDDTDVRESIEHAQHSFAYTQERIGALESACTEKVKRNKNGWACGDTIAMLGYVDTAFEGLKVHPTLGDEAKELQERARKLREDTRLLDAKLKASF